MRRLLLVALLVLAVPHLSFAASCAAGSLLDYIGFGSAGCQIGAATFFDFGAGPSFSGGLAIDPALIAVLPQNLALGPRLDFMLTAAAGPGDILGAAIGYSIGSRLSAARLSMDGSASAGDGIALVIQDICVGNVFLSDPSNCQNPPPVSLIVVHDSFGSTGPVASPLGPSSFFDVFTDITLDGGLAGSGSLGSVGAPGTITNQFVTPEPSTVLLLGSGLVALCALRRRRIFN